MPKKETDFTAILSVIAGIIVLIWPNILGIAVGLYLILSGLLDLYRKNNRA